MKLDWMAKAIFRLDSLSLEKGWGVGPERREPGNHRVSGCVHSLREELARFLTYYCKAPASLNPDNVSQSLSLPVDLVVGCFLGAEGRALDAS